MSTCVLDRASGVRGYEHLSIRERGGGVVMRMRPASLVTCCPKCRGRKIVHRGTVPRSWSAPPIARKPVTLFADLPRIECRHLATAYYLKEDLRQLWEQPKKRGPNGS